MAVSLTTSTAAANSGASSVANAGPAPAVGATASSHNTCYASSVFLVVGGPAGGEVRLTRGGAQSASAGAVRSGAGVAAATPDGASDDDDNAPASRTPLLPEQRRGAPRVKGGFGLLPIAFLDRLVECASVSGGDGARESSAPLAGTATLEGGVGRWATLRQCRVPALFSAAGGSSTGGSAAADLTPAAPGGSTGSKRVMSAMQVRHVCSPLPLPVTPPQQSTTVATARAPNRLCSANACLPKACFRETLEVLQQLQLLSPAWSRSRCPRPSSPRSCYGRLHLVG